LINQSPTSQLLAVLPEKKKVHVLKYITERRCQKGGYCFYRQEEPNLSDSYYALASQRILGTETEDIDTINYILNSQRSNGSYLNITHAYYAINSLYILNKKQLYSPKSFIFANLHSYNPENLLPGTNSVFKKMHFVISLMNMLNLAIPLKRKESVSKFVLYFKKSDTGFGVERSTLLETAHALTILAAMDYPLEKLQTAFFLRKCEHSIFGFTNIHSTSLSYLEYLHAGLVLSQLLEYKINYATQCLDFVLNCQTNKGGFARSIDGGIATLENTFYAINSLAILESILLDNFH